MVETKFATVPILVLSGLPLLNLKSSKQHQKMEHTNQLHGKNQMLYRLLITLGLLASLGACNTILMAKS